MNQQANMSAQGHDHRELNKRLHIFGYLQAKIGGVGLLSWLPNGEIIRQELEHFAKEMEAKDGYDRVSTPILAPKQLYETSGHYPYYKESMYPPVQMDEQEYLLRPMNCPHHHMVAKELLQRGKLPLRLAEFGHVHRYESHGNVSGLMRARGFTQNDAHIYCTENQVESELLGVLDLHRRYYEKFDISDFYMSLALPDPSKQEKFIDEPAAWGKSVQMLKSALDKSNLPYIEEIGEAAFYGPKIDFIIKSKSGTNYTISTTQLDFMAAKRFFYLRHKTHDEQEHPLYVIHRAPLGSHERFIGFLLEHYEGKLPTWLSPMQAVVIPIAERHNEFAKNVAHRVQEIRVFNSTGQLRVVSNLEKDHMNNKIRRAKNDEVPYSLIIGDREQANDSVAVRLRDGKNLVFKVNEFITLLEQEVNERRDLIAGKPNQPTKNQQSQLAHRNIDPK